MGKMREEFENFTESRGFDRNYYFSRGVHPNYYDHDTINEMWMSWKASREFLVVEIPKTGEVSSFGDYVVFDTECVQEMLDEVGVKYK